MDAITHQKVHVPCCVLYRYFFHRRISAWFYVDLSATFLNFQYSSRSSYIVNLMTPQNFPALCCNFTRMFFTWNSWNTSIFFLDLFDPSFLQNLRYDWESRQGLKLVVLLCTSQCESPRSPMGEVQGILTFDNAASNC